MKDEKRLRETIDRSEIINLIGKSIICRDAERWSELGDCYHPDAAITSSFFSELNREAYVDISPKMKIDTDSGESQKHLTGNHWIEIRGNRAVAEADLVLFQRRFINGIELDFSTFSRRLHLVEKREDGDWKIWKRTSIYEKGRMDPVNPEEIPEDFYSSMDLSKYPPLLRYHCWRNEMAGYPPATKLCLKGSKEEKAVRDAARDFLAAA